MTMQCDMASEQTSGVQHVYRLFIYTHTLCTHVLCS